MAGRLAGSEAALREAQAIAHLGSWAPDYRSGELVWSDETYRLLGFRPGIVTPSLEVFFSVVHAEDRARVQEALEVARRRADGSYSVEHRVRGSDGIPRVIQEKGHVRFNDDGEAQGISGTALDITERRRVEDALRAQEERYRLVIENLEDLIVRTDPDGRFDFVSPSYCRLVGVPEEELLGRHLLQLLLPPHACQIEQRVATVSGWRWLQWVDRVVLDDAGRVEWVVALGRDITERKQAEFDLLQREQLERGLLELSAVFLQRPELGMDPLINQALARMGQLTGTDRAYLFNADTERRIFNNTHEWTAPGVAPMIGRLQKIPWDITPDSVKLLAAGSPVVIPRVAELEEAWVGKAFLESQGIRSLLILPVMQGENLTGFVGFDAVRSAREWSSAEIHFLQVFASLMVSAIEREQAYSSMVAARERETIGHLASGVAHDFNNLLGVIDANFFYLQQMLVHPGAEPEIAQILEETHSALGQAKVVTSGMLSLSRAGTFSGERVTLDTAIEELARILRQVLPPETHLVLLIEPDLAVRSNNAFLQAALLNLVLNARDALPDGGRLTIEAVGEAWPGGAAARHPERSRTTIRPLPHPASGSSWRMTIPEAGIRCGACCKTTVYAWRRPRTVRPVSNASNAIRASIWFCPMSPCLISTESAFAGPCSRPTRPFRSSS